MDRKGGARVPTRKEYRVFRLNFTAEQRASVDAELSVRGLTRAALDPASPEFEKWIGVRRSLFAEGVPAVLSANWQSCDSQVKQVNADLSALEYVYPAALYDSIFSSAVERTVNCQQLIPCSEGAQ
jgi:hypothetical protein